MTTSSSMATLPSMKLRSRPVCDILNQQIITPVMQNQWGVSAFRMSWNRQILTGRNMWEQIVFVREQLDKLVQLVPGVLFFVSAINGTAYQPKPGEESTYRAHPGVAYWLVSPHAVIDQRSLCNLMNSNNCEATLKLLLQPYQTSEKDVRNALFSGVKDNMEGCVRHLVEESCAYCYGPEERLREPLIKVYISRDGPRDMLAQAFNDLTAVRFRSEIIDLGRS